MPSISKWLRIGFLAVVLPLVPMATSHAAVTSHFVTNGVVVIPASYGGNFLNASKSIYIDPSTTNWIAWHDHTTPDPYGSQELVGANDWLGVDDFLKVTIQKQGGGSTSKTTMDSNNSSGVAYGPQAVFYGTAAGSPDVRRKTSYSGMGVIDEGGLFNSFFDTQGAGDYTFSFEFWDAYSGSYRVNPFYILVDAEEAVPEPSSMIVMLGLGSLGLTACGIRRKRRGVAS